MTHPPRLFDRDLLATRRERAARHPDLPDFLLARAAEEIAGRLGLVRREFEVAADLGAHHGLVGRAVEALPSVGRLVSVERSATLLGRCTGLLVCADPEALPFADVSLDLVVSGLSLHFVNDLPGALIQIRRALKPDGLFLACVLGGETLVELKTALLAAEAETDRGAGPRVGPFADVRDYGGLLQRAGFALPVADAERLSVRYTSPLHLMRELRGMGATNILGDRPRVPLARATLRRACEIYQDRFSNQEGRITATFELIALLGWAPHDSQQKPLPRGSARMRLEDALRPTKIP